MILSSIIAITISVLDVLSYLGESDDEDDDDEGNEEQLENPLNSFDQEDALLSHDPDENTEPIEAETQSSDSITSNTDVGKSLLGGVLGDSDDEEIKEVPITGKESMINENVIEQQEDRIPEQEDISQMCAPKPSFLD